MSALIADPPKQLEPAVEPEAMPAARGCANCGSPLVPGQDWCLECGTAAPGRFGRMRGLRSSLGIVGITLVLVLGAVAAAYAALSSDANQAARTPVRVAQTPPPAAAPATAPTVTAPAVRPAPALPQLPVTPTPKPVHVTPAPKLPVVTTPTTTHPVTTTPTVTTPTTTPTTHTTPTPTTPTTAKIQPDTNAASSYNPFNYAAASFGDPSLAIDGDPTTAWTYQLDPATAGKVAVGLALDLTTPQKLGSVKVKTGSPGMRVEIYGANGQLPVSILDPNWTHLATRNHIGAHPTVQLKTQGHTFRFLLIWIAHAPPGRVQGTVGISELTLFS